MVTEELRTIGVHEGFFEANKRRNSIINYRFGNISGEVNREKQRKATSNDISSGKPIVIPKRVAESSRKLDLLPTENQGI